MLQIYITIINKFQILQIIKYFIYKMLSNVTLYLFNIFNIHVCYYFLTVISHPVVASLSRKGDRPTGTLPRRRVTIIRRVILQGLI